MDSTFGPPAGLSRSMTPLPWRPSGNPDAVTGLFSGFDFLSREVGNPLHPHGLMARSGAFGWRWDRCLRQRGCIPFKCARSRRARTLLFIPMDSLPRQAFYAKVCVNVDVTAGRHIDVTATPLGRAPTTLSVARSRLRRTAMSLACGWSLFARLLGPLFVQKGSVAWDSKLCSDPA